MGKFLKKMSAKFCVLDRLKQLNQHYFELLGLIKNIRLTPRTVKKTLTKHRKCEPVYIPIAKQIWQPRSCLLSFFTSNEGSNQSFLVVKALGLYIFYRKQKCYGLNWEKVCEIQLGKGRVTASENARLHPDFMERGLLN